jgi:putative hydrolase of the HAD superfamily
MNTRTGYINLIKKLNLPLAPLPTNLVPLLKPVKAKAAIFDLYGTLFISKAGDVGPDAAADDEQAFIEALTDGGWDPAGIERKSVNISHLFRAEIKKARQKRREQRILYPEIDILQIWSALLTSLKLAPRDKQNIKRAAVSYECRVNPIWPMPGMPGIITTLQKRGLKLGIISNAQFYTPLIIEALTGSLPEDLGFDPELIIWSYQELQGKPSLFLFEQLGASLFQQNIHPNEILYIGNDMLKDIRPAARSGWQTALFAGDSRSLRLYEDDAQLHSRRPDLIITDLSQLIEVIQPN